MKKIALVAIVLVCFYFAVLGIEWERLWTIFTTAQGSYVLAAVPVLLVSYLVRALRWHYLLPHEVRRQSRHILFPTLMIGYFANNFLPARGGELARVILMGRCDGISRSGVLATIMAERTFDGLCLSVVAFLAIRRFTLDELQWISHVGLAFLGVFLVLLVVM